MERFRRCPGLVRLASCCLAGALVWACSDGGSRRPNLILISLDTTRADRLGCYGYERPTTPRLDELAQDSVIYTNAYAVSSWTMPSHASMFTGKYPSAHGARYDPDGVLKLSEGIQGDFGHYRAQPIADNEVTLAALLGERGWRTAGIAGGPWMKKIFRLDKGFDQYDDDNIDHVNGRTAEDITRVAKEFVDGSARRPFFLFLNYYDPHGPYINQPEHIRPLLKPGENPNNWERTAQMNILYDGEIRYMDEHIGVLLDHLRMKGLYENTWIIVTADHGELMGEEILGGDEAFGHGHSLSEAEIRIPMIVKHPASSSRTGRDASLVQQTDILPTVLAGFGIPLPPNVQGQAFGQRDQRVFAEVYPLPIMSQNKTDWRMRGDWQVMLDESFKFGRNSYDRHFLVNLGTDPGESSNVLNAHPSKGHEMEGMIRAFLESLPEPGGAAAGAIDEDTLRQLKGAGYMGDDSQREQEGK